MEDILYDILVIFLVLNAIFWSLGAHSQHCHVASLMGFKDCPSHSLHISFGVLSFLLAVVISQRKFFFS